MKEKVSIIIPTYNRANIITKSIESVLNQTYENLELIIVDDGSSDNTEEVVKSINDRRIRYYKMKKNGGTAVARNFGISKAKCKYIFFQDSDDIFRNNKIEIQLKNMIENNSAMDFCKICIHEGDNEILVPTNEDDIKIANEGIVNKLCENNVVSTQAILIKTEIAKKYQFDPNIPNTDDYDLALRVAIDNKVSYTNIPLVDIYRQSDSITYSMEKLRKSSLSMIKKDYKLSSEQLKKLYDNLLFHASRNKYEEYYSEIQQLSKSNEELKKDLEELQNKNIKLESINDKLNEEKKNFIKKNKELESNCNDLNNKYNDYKEKYNSIINSKRWKFTSKLLKIIGK